MRTFGRIITMRGAKYQKEYSTIIGKSKESGLVLTVAKQENSISHKCTWCGRPLTQGQIIHPDCFQEQLREN